eukprot:GILK01003012.1.p1 GENE.GILK01003012.1~~GILK01003012.1.p1  ORF type:complete len:401 (+),score=41.52 GILK01003012.1:42-1205(+)
MAALMKLLFFLLVVLVDFAQANRVVHMLHHAREVLAANKIKRIRFVNFVGVGYKRLSNGRFEEAKVENLVIAIGITDEKYHDTVKKHVDTLKFKYPVQIGLVLHGKRDKPAHSGSARAGAFLQAEEEISTRSVLQTRTKHDPLCLGETIYLTGTQFLGTVGFFIFRAADQNEAYLVTNHHVLATHAGRHRIMCAHNEHKATRLGANHNRFGEVLSTKLDVGVAHMEAPWLCQFPDGTAIDGWENGLTAEDHVLAQTHVKKYGQTTGLTDGHVRYFGDIHQAPADWVAQANGDQNLENMQIFDHSSNALPYEDQMVIWNSNGLGHSFSEGGDSGSAIVDFDSNKIIGLLHGGEDDPNNPLYSYAMPIKTVMDWIDQHIPNGPFTVCHQ